MTRLLKHGDVQDTLMVNKNIIRTLTSLKLSFFQLFVKIS